MTTDHASRCSWAEGDALMRAYHDEEWGVPERDSRKLWEMLFDMLRYHLIGALAELGQPYYYYQNMEGGHAAAANLPETARRLAMEYVYGTQRLVD